jgi:hypothetical protein
MRFLFILIAAIGMLSACATPSQRAADAEVRRLCAIDGGIKVYETVELPPEKFNEWGQINFLRYTQGENALGAEYIFKREITYFEKVNPHIIRFHSKVIRRDDSKLLGETTLYKRSGGDLPLPGYPSSYFCPSVNEADVNALLKQIFIKSTEERIMP